MESKREINHRVMNDTLERYTSDPALKAAVAHSISKEKIILEDDVITTKYGNGVPSIVLSPEFTFEAAAKYVGQRIGVLDFANNHHPGGSPFSAGAQEESMCRSTTLFPCLLAKKNEFYKIHSDAFDNGHLTYLGNDDAIFVPDVVVFKSQESEPKLLPQEKWFLVDVIVSAAPETSRYGSLEEKVLRGILHKRIKRIMDIASSEGIEVLILGAFGCGAFGNPTHLVASVMKELVCQYSFKTVDFAIRGYGDGLDPNYIVFKNVFEME